VILVTFIAGTVTAQSAPNCSNVNYDGDGTTNNPYEVSNLNELQCINEDHGNASDRTDALTSDYILVSDIDASDTSAWNSGDGFEPIGEFSDAFNATFDGDGYEITELTIDRGSDDDVGLFGTVESAGTVANVTVTNVDITGSGETGALVGENKEGTVSNSGATGSVTGSNNEVGGLVGYNDGGDISDSYAEVTVTSSDDEVGGLAGENDGGTVSNSYATGEVKAEDDDNDVGGLTGENDDGTVSNSYATGDVEGDDNLGGLIGYNNGGTVSESYATGDVEGYESGSLNSLEVGGLVGENYNGDIEESYATGNVSGDDDIGGIVGYNNGGPVTDSYATGNVLADSDVGGIVGYNSQGTVERSYAAGNVSGNSNVGGAVGDNSGSVTDSYWDVNTTNRSASDGGTGLTTDEMTGNDATSNMSGLDFSNTWTVVGDDSYPKLAWSAPPNFGVEIINTDSPVPEGNTLEVDARITNRGFLEGTQDIPLRIEGSSEDVELDLTLGAGESAVRTLEWNTGASSNGTYTATVESENDTDTARIFVGQKPEFDVSIVSTNSPVQERETLEVTAEIDNTGSVTDTQEVVLNVSGERDSVDATVDPNTNSFETLEWATEAGDEGTYTAEVASEDSNDSTGVTVQRNSSIAPADYQLSNLPDLTATEGDSPVDVPVDVSNVGGQPGDQEIEFEVTNSSGVVYNDTLANVQVDDGNTTTVNFTGVPVGGLAQGDYTHTATSDNDTVTANLTVQSSGGGPSGVDQYREDPSDPNSSVRLSGLQNAIQDFINNSIDLSLLQNVIQEFIST